LASGLGTGLTPLFPLPVVYFSVGHCHFPMLNLLSPSSYCVPVERR
jgi:hypothetical protein